MWAVMKALTFDSMNTNHIKMITPPEGIGQPQRFMPIFNLKEDAEKFAKENNDIIVELTLVGTTA